MSTQNLLRARRILEEGDYTCVICNADLVYTTTARGVRPLVRWIKNGTDMTGHSAADKVVGRATAYLYCLLRVEEVYARVMSEQALEVLLANGIRGEYDRLVPNIINRKGDGICPFEEAVLHITDPCDAWNAILRKMEAMGIKV